MREKLIALLNLAPTDYAGNSNPIRTADYLIANGVTVREKGEWILQTHDDGYGEFDLWHC
jgi:hypothetical protein